ncbi:MAG: 3-hydroxyacyl-CoA dehydrogenase family protein [Solirubrobacteraceae bacterium]
MTSAQTAELSSETGAGALRETLGIAGSGTIATGLAAVAAQHGEVLLWARSESSAQRARKAIAKACAKLDESLDPERVEIVTDLDELRRSSYVVEAVVEEHEPKAAVLKELAAHENESAILATTTSSLSIEQLALATGRPDKFCGLHVFNPVPRMALVELVFPAEASDSTRERSRALCEALGKTAVEVPDIPGFVVNRLLFPYLFSAVELMSDNGMAPGDIDKCMTLGAGLPMGPIALLDFVGLDVSAAIGESIGATVPAMLTELIGEGALGRKAGRGFYDYS